MRVAVTGATGFVGRRLVALLVEQGRSVTALTRDADRAREVLGSDVTVRAADPLDAAAVGEAIRGCDAVVNLQGANLFAKRWRPRVLEAIRASRIDTTRALVEAMQDLEARPQALVSASAIGIYGNRPPDVILDEDDADPDAASSSAFLAGLCAAWEREAMAAEALGVRVVRLRIGVVLGRGGGALQAMEGPYRKFVGGPVGSGKQASSWIHLDDLCRLVLYAVDQDALSGAVNATAPNPVSNKALGKAFGRAIHRPSWLPAPRLALRLALGGVASVVTEGQHVLPRRALEHGFTFRHPTVEEALADLYP